MNKTLIKVSAPGKLMLFGEHAVIYGKPCIVTAVDERMHLSMQRTADNYVVIDAPDVDVKNFKITLSEIGSKECPKSVEFILEAIEIFFNKYKIASGLKIKTKSEFSSLFGFGSSSAVTVCTIKALSEIFDIKVSNKELFDMSYKTVLSVQGVGSGFDLAVAVSGGTIYFVKDGKIIKPIIVDKLPLIVGYTGVKADTATLVRRVGELYKYSKTEIDEIFCSISNIVEKSVLFLKDNDYVKLGELMNQNQKLLEKLEVSSPELDNLINAANAAGAYGAKLSGAGGGDCMVALADKKIEKTIEKSIKQAGGVIIPVKTGAEGVRIEK